MEGTLGFEAQMRDKLPARQMQRHMANDARLIEDRDRARGVDKYQFPGVQLKEPIFVIYG